jgi:protoporphyrinogen oxidase
MKLVVLGGGVAGVVASAYAVEKGINDISLIEREDFLGGLHRDNIVDGLHFDIGAFFFWPFHKVLEVFPEIKNVMYRIESTNFWSLTEKGSIDFYPPTAKGYINDWGLANFGLDVLELISNRIQTTIAGKKFDSVDDEMKYYFGPFYEKIGLKNYIARLYGMPPSEISLQFSQKRLDFIKNRLRTGELVKRLSRFRIDELNRYKILPTFYARPTTGFSTMYGYIHQELEKKKVNLNLNKQIKQILINEKKVITHSDEVYTYDYLLSSIPLGIFCKLCNVPLNIKLDYKPLYSLFYESECEAIPDCHALFNFTQRGFWKRITFHSSYYGAEGNRNYFVIESMPEDQYFNHPDTVNVLDHDFKKTFAQTKWDKAFSQAKLIGHHKTPNAYPIYRKNFDPKAIEEVKDFFAQNSIYLVGRQGEFDYLSSSDVAVSSVNTIDKILIASGQRVNLT